MRKVDFGSKLFTSSSFRSPSKAIVRVISCSPAHLVSRRISSRRCITVRRNSSAQLLSALLLSALLLSALLLSALLLPKVRLSKMTTPREPHFFKPLLPGFHSGVTIPLEFYSKHLQGSQLNKPWKLKSDGSDAMWEVIQEGRTLTKGWKEFTEAHDLRIGDIVILKQEGDLVFHVTPFGPSGCEIQYTHLQANADAAPALSYDYCFVAEVTATNQKDDKMYLPVEAMWCTALNQQCKEVKLVNKEGKSWSASFRFTATDGAYYINRGWRKFCHDNRCCNGDLFVFNVVGDGTTTPLLCVCPERKECTQLLINYISRNNGQSSTT